MRAARWFAGLVWICAAGNLLAGNAQPAPELDALFQHETGWIGADGDFSVPLGDDTTLWLFSDSLVGKVVDGRRTNATMIHNSIAIQHGKARPEFFYGATPEGKADSFIKPVDGKGYYWIFSGTRAPAGLYFFLQQVETVNNKSVFGFKMTGTWLAAVANPDDPPTQWKIQQSKLPFGDFGGKGDLVFGSSLLRDGDYAYVYGVDGRKSKDRARNGMVVARVPADKFANFSEWRFLADGQWQDDWKRVTPLCGPMATEYSVSWLPGVKKYAAVTSESLSGTIKLRLSPTPIGPWEKPSQIFECPELKWPDKAFCYAAKAHPELATAPDELVITYAANSWEFAQLFKDARLYWPRFIRMDVGAESPAN
jgi:predicted transcriptional regulator YdeE